jgi:cell division septation protein DedD
MADQTRFRSQQRDPGLPQASTSGAKGGFSPRGEDPLAELARLIGQDDPFASFSDDPRGAPNPSSNAYASRNGRDRHNDRDQDYDERDAYDRTPEQRSRRHADEDPRPANANVARKNGRGAYAYGGGREEAPYWQLPESNTAREPNDGRPLPPQTAKRPPQRQPDYTEEPETDYEDPRYARTSRGENGYADPRQVDPRRTDPRQVDPRQVDLRQVDPRYDHGPYEQDEADGYEPEYEEDRYGEYDEQAYVDPAHGRRRWLYIGGAAAIALLVVGGTGVYGYRALFGKYSGGSAPTIRPADTPTKVAPQTTAQTGEGGQKLIYDRLDGPKQSERIVSREEQPAEVAQNAGRVVAAPQPAGPVTAFAPVAATPQNAPAAITGSPPAAAMPSSEPRKVRTTTVRADGTIVDTPRPAQPAVAQRPAQGQPLALSPTSQQPLADDPDAQPQAGAPVARTAALAPAPARTSQPANQQPWAVLQQPATAPAASAPQQTSNYVPAGSYVVQVASQKSEADARTSWQQLQAKYSNVFGNYQANIKRVDLGDRGTFYRAMLGPFSNRDQAYEMCQNLKAAGGECIVQRN